MQQTELFEIDYVTHYERNKLPYEFPTVGDVTFLNGLSEPVHRWFRLTPSYSPELVRFLVSEMDCSGKTFVCDPFLGKGTTAIELKKLGVPFIGIEINPVLKLASEYALTWDVETAKLAQHFKELELKISNELSKAEKHSLENVVEERGLEIPKIHDVFRWWKKNVLRDLLIVKDACSVSPT